MQEMKGILDRLEEVERVNVKLKKKDKDKFTWSKKGCETQFKFNSKVKDIAVDKMRVELRKHFKTLPPKIEELIKEGEKEIDDGNHKLKIANDFGFKAVEEFVKDDLARNDEEGKKIKRFRKEKKEREEKLRSIRGVRGGRGGFRGFGGYFGGNRSGFVKETQKGEPLPGTLTSPRTSSASSARATGTWPGSAPRPMYPGVGSEEE